jgi:hypothetical protein
MQPAPARAKFQRILIHSHVSAKLPLPRRTSLWTRFSPRGTVTTLLRAHKKGRAV